MGTRLHEDMAPLGWGSLGTRSLGVRDLWGHGAWGSGVPWGHEAHGLEILGDTEPGGMSPDWPTRLPVNCKGGWPLRPRPLKPRPSTAQATPPTPAIPRVAASGRQHRGTGGGTVPSLGGSFPSPGRVPAQFGVVLSQFWGILHILEGFYAQFGGLPVQSEGPCPVWGGSLPSLGGPCPVLGVFFQFGVSFPSFGVSPSSLEGSLPSLGCPFPV